MSSGAATGGPACALCNKAAPTQCGSCHDIRYCSSMCQKADWSVHKIVCKSFHNVLESPEPSSDLVRAIYFPEHGSRPRFVWVRQRGTTKGGKLKIDISDLDISEERKGDFGEREVFDYSHVLQRAIPPLTWNWSFATDRRGMMSMRGKYNSSTAAINKELLPIVHGPVIFHAPNRNLDTTDFRNVVDTLRWHHYSCTHIAKQKDQYDFATQPSVMISCLGDKAICHQPSYTELPLPAEVITPDNPRLMQIPIGDLVGLPLYGVHTPAGLPYRQRAILSPNGKALPADLNHNIVSLQPFCDPIDMGSVCVTRKDGKYIHVAHVDALVRYSESITNGQKQIVMPGARAALLKAKATAKGFKTFWEKLKSEGKFAGVQSPYEV